MGQTTALDWSMVIGKPVPIDPSRDPEKQPTAAADTFRIMGVQIHSRYGKHDELVLMAEMVAAMPPRLRRAMKLLWCDSKNTCTYAVKLHTGMDKTSIAKPIADHLHEMAWRLDGGHNGIYCPESEVRHIRDSHSAFGAIRRGS